ncbi:MAG: DUF192 domain-containing protein [Armatimonadota bacterium]|nr:DUF192 domain-containing protein [Armatimonadota bacterium]
MTLFSTKQGVSFSLIHAPSGQTVARVVRADGFWAQGQGVIGLKELAPGEGLWLPGVASVHTFFVRFPLDLLFLDAQFRQLRACPAVPPWRPLIWAAGARHTVELGAGTLERLPAASALGDAWELRAV